MPTNPTRLEYWTYRDAAGTTFDLTVPSAVGRWVLSDSGMGLPPLDFITERGPAQHGASVTDVFLLPRTVQLLVRANACSRGGYWDQRAALLNGLRFNRQLTPNGVAPGVLTLRRADGVRRSLDCYLTQGPNFEPRQPGQWQEWSYQEVLRFTAYNPVLYDPAVHVQGFMLPDQLVFPITFPIVFGGLDASENIAYAGTWLEYPTIELTGPMDNPSVENLTTGETIALTYSIPLGVTVTITLTYGNKTVTDSVGNNLIGTVTPTSDLASWHLAPDPEAPGGVNSIHVSANSVGAAASAVIRYFDRYLGM